jgi:hypothetical protein
VVVVETGHTQRVAVADRQPVDASHKGTGCVGTNVPLTALLCIPLAEKTCEIGMEFGDW